MKIIYTITYGSDAYGTTMADSDNDIRGILLPTIDECLSMKGLKDIRIMNDKEDRVMYPIQKFFRLAVKSNPSVFEWLFVPQNCIRIMKPAGKLIRDNREIFLSKELYHRFKGFAHSEFASLTKLTSKTGLKRKKQILKFGFSPKNAMNVIRLMEQGVELLETSYLSMPRPNAEYLKNIKRGKITYKEIVNLFNELLKKLEIARDNTKLPDEPQFEKADKLLINILKTYS